MSAPAPTPRPTTAAVSASVAPTVAVPTTAVPTSALVTTTRRTTRRTRTSTRSTYSPTASVVPYDNNAERRSNALRTNKILIGVFSALGAILLGLLVFRLLRSYRRRRQANAIPLPAPRDPMIYRQSRASLYKDYPSPAFSRPASVAVRNPSASGFFATPSARSSAPSMEKFKVDESGRLSTEPARTPFQGPYEDSSDNSITGSAILPTDEETGPRFSPLGSRSQSPSNQSVPRRPESRTRYARPNSVASTSRHSYLNAPNWQHRNSVHGSARPASYYASGNHGAPHTPHVRDRVGLVMPQPLAPELFNYALGGRHDMGLNFMQGSWGSNPNLAREPGSNQPLVPPRRVRTDSWVGSSHTGDTTLASDVAPPSTSNSLPRGRSGRPEIPEP